MTVQTNNFYLGIDLGTTNSVLAWGRVDARSGRVIPMVAELRSMSAGQGMVKQALLPSCVYYKRGSEQPIVGGYARTMIGRQSSRVIKSVKSAMGSGKKYVIDEQELSPSCISAAILRQIASASQELFGFIPDDVVITVPASFDSDQRSDTIEAARLAGFKVTNEDGSPRNILMDEPRAALCDFINRQERGEIPETLIDFSSPQNVLVFDLGGGTLDVSFHQVRRSDGGNGNVEVKDYAISRYTQLGGDNFDQLLQEFFIEKFSDKLDISCLDEFTSCLVRNNFLDEAERAKIELNAMVENRRLQGQSGTSGLVHEILRPNIFESHLFEYDLSIEEYRSVIRPLLAPELSMESLERFDCLGTQSYNIIYPILDVLNKARMKLGHLPHVDAVLLNGGMSKLFAVRERLEEFFGFAPLEVGDPDKSVARGAVVHHHALHKGARPVRIQNENLGIALKGGHLLNLVRAGAPLPYSTGVIDMATTEEQAMTLDLPFYVGSRDDIQPPNRRMATRRVRFDRPLPRDTPVQIRATVDEAGIVSLEGWGRDAPDVRFSVLAVSGEIEREPVSRIQNNPSVSLPKSWRRRPKLGVRTDKIVDMHALIKRYEKVGARNSCIDACTTKKLKEIERSIAEAANCDQALLPLIRIVKWNSRLSVRAVRLMGRIVGHCSREEAAVGLQALEKICSVGMLKTLYGCSWNIGRAQDIVHAAIVALGKLSLPSHEKLFLDMMHHRHLIPGYYVPALCCSLGRTGNSEEAVRAVAEFMGGSDGERIAAYWALGHIGSREKKNPLPISCFEDVLPKMFRHLHVEPHGDVARNGVYAIGEICDRRGLGSSDRISEHWSSFITPLLNSLGKRKFRVGGRDVARWVKIAEAMLRGSDLDAGQKEHLLKLRVEG